jgi:hypothetical protein
MDKKLLFILIFVVASLLFLSSCTYEDVAAVAKAQGEAQAVVEEAKGDAAPKIAEADKINAEADDIRARTARDNAVANEKLRHDQELNRQEEAVGAANQGTKIEERARVIKGEADNEIRADQTRTTVGNAGLVAALTIGTGTLAGLGVITVYFVWRRSKAKAVQPVVQEHEGTLTIFNPVTAITQVGSPLVPGLFTTIHADGRVVPPEHVTPELLALAIGAYVRLRVGLALAEAVKTGARKGHNLLAAAPQVQAAISSAIGQDPSCRQLILDAASQEWSQAMQQEPGS